MDKVVRVVSRQRFQEWLESAATPKDIPLPKLGEQLYSQQGCQSCHSLDGSRKVGPSFQGLYGKTNHQMGDGSSVVADENYLRQSILQPEEKIVQGYQNLMPGAYSSLSERQLTALIEFIKAQSDKEAPQSDAERTATGQGA
jgi:cytochrome c oxidase subunit 2